jgi:hypothetical protein
MADSGEAGPGTADAAPVAGQLGEIPAIWIGGYGPVFPVEIEATDFIGREPSKQELSTSLRRDPLLFQFLEIHGANEVLTFQVALSIAGVAIHEFKDQIRRISFILAASGPDHGAKAQILPVELEDVEEVSNLGTSDDREELIRRQVGRMKAVSKVLVSLGGKETEGRVGRPIEPNMLITSADDRPEEALRAHRPFDGVSGFPEQSFIGLDACGHDLGRARTAVLIEPVMEDIDVVGDAESRLSPVDYGAAHDMALGFAIRRDQAGDTLLEIG